MSRLDRSAAPRMTAPKYVVMFNGSAGSDGGARYLQRDLKTWGDYATAKRFNSDADAEPYTEPGAHGIFPCSTPRPIKAKCAAAREE